jgi:hypothetical protein
MTQATELNFMLDPKTPKTITRHNKAHNCQILGSLTLWPFALDRCHSDTVNTINRR